MDAPKMNQAECTGKHDPVCPLCGNVEPWSNFTNCVGFHDCEACGRKYVVEMREVFDTRPMGGWDRYENESRS